MWRAALIAGTGFMTPAVYGADQAHESRGFALSSPDITPGGTIAPAQVFNSFGCSGQNISPALSWSHAPQGTQSFALLVHDPDAPTGSGWWHWLVYNIPAAASSLPAGAGDPKAKLLPSGALQGRTDYGAYAYGGPCPPPGMPHHRKDRPRLLATGGGRDTDEVAGRLAQERR